MRNRAASPPTARAAAKSPFPRAFASLLVGAAVLPGAALAAPGDHIRVGKSGELVPTLTLLGVYRTNNYLTPGSTFGDGPDDAAVSGMHLSVRPGIQLELESRPIEIGFRVGYEARKYFAEELQNLDRFRNVNAGLSLSILPQGVVGVDIDTGVVVTGRETEAVNSQDAYLQQTVSRNTLMLAVRPGNALEVRGGGAFEVRDINVPPDFVQTDGQPSANLNNQAGYGFVADLTWKFLPKTAVVANFERQTNRWESNSIAATGAGAGEFGIETDPVNGGFQACVEGDANGLDDCFLPVPNSVFTTFEAGIRGRFTEKLVLGVIGGFTRANFDSTSVSSPQENTQMVETDDPAKCNEPNGGDTDGVNDDRIGFPCAFSGSVEIAYDMLEEHRLKLGVAREAQPVFFTNYLDLTRYYIGYDGTFADRHRVRASAEFNNQDYRGQVTRDDLWYRARADVGWGITNWLTIDSGIWYTGRRSADGANPEIEYDDVNVHAGVTLTY